MKTLICIPVYNGEKYIQNTILSCLKQSVKCEIWIVDNCSTDNTCDVVKKFLAKNVNIKLFKNEKNLGRTGNWNKCLDMFMLSSFEYIKFLFPGDQIHSDCIEKTERIFLTNKNIGAIYFPYDFVDNNGKGTVIRRFNEDKLIGHKEITKIQLSEGSQLGAIVSNLYSRHAIKDNRFTLNQITKNDFDIKVLESHSLYYLNECLASFLAEAHNSLWTESTSWLQLNVGYVNAKEHHRLKQKNFFSDKENIEIEQSNILVTVQKLLSFLSFSARVKLIVMIVNSIFILILKKIYSKFKNVIFKKK